MMEMPNMVFVMAMMTSMMQAKDTDAMPIFNKVCVP